MIYYVVAIVLIAFVFDFINGFHDSANSIATIVGTRVLSPIAAVVWAAFFNFTAAFTAGELDGPRERMRGPAQGAQHQPPELAAPW